MKYPLDQFDLLVKALRILIPLFELTKEQCLTVGSLHNLHFNVYMNYTYSISHPMVLLTENKERILPLTESFELYPKGCNDPHIETAMKKAINLIFKTK